MASGNITVTDAAGHAVPITVPITLIGTGPALGVNVTNLLDWKAKGGPTKWTRIFAQTGSWSPTSSQWKPCVDAANRGEKVAVSSKPPGTMDQISAGTYDSFFRAIATGLAGLATKGVYTFYHEPEDNIQNGEFSFAQFIAASTRVYSQMRPILQPAGWRTGICFMSWTVNPSSGRNLNNYLNTGLLNLVDVLAWDCYNDSGAGDGGSAWALTDPRLVSPSSLFGPCVTATTSRSKTPMIFETGCARRQADSTGSERTQWWQSVAAYSSMQQFEAIMHYEMGQANSRSEWAIRDEPASLAAFKSISP